MNYFDRCKRQKVQQHSALLRSLQRYRQKNENIRVNAIAQWDCQRLPSCGSRFESQAHHLRFNIAKFCTKFVIVLRKG